jgi:hypothetical protein
MPDSQSDIVKKFQSLGFTVIGKAANGNVFVELRGNDPVRASVGPDGTVVQLSGDVSRFDWSGKKGRTR